MSLRRLLAHRPGPWCPTRLTRTARRLGHPLAQYTGAAAYLAACFTGLYLLGAGPTALVMIAARFAGSRTCRYLARRRATPWERCGCATCVTEAHLRWWDDSEIDLPALLDSIEARHGRRHDLRDAPAGEYHLVMPQPPRHGGDQGAWRIRVTALDELHRIWDNSWPRTLDSQLARATSRRPVVVTGPQLAALRRCLSRPVESVGPLDELAADFAVTLSERLPLPEAVAAARAATGR